MAKKLYKSRKNKILFGVGGGIAEFFNIDPTIVRILFVVLTLFSGSGIIIYIVAALIMPQKEKLADEDYNVDHLKSANMDSDEKKEKAKESRGTTNSKAHTDEEFDSYFK